MFGLDAGRCSPSRAPSRGLLRKGADQSCIYTWKQLAGIWSGSSAPPPLPPPYPSRGGVGRDGGRGL
eukprot:7799060-Alexandrium_andersonii.AAC.1